MTWPQYERHECSIGGHVVRLQPQEAEIVLKLLLGHPDGYVPTGALIELLYPDPDAEPEYALKGVHKRICVLRRYGFPIEFRYPKYGAFNDTFGGYCIPRAARGRPAPLVLAA